MEVNVIPGSVFVHPLVFFSILFSKYCLFCLFGPVVWLYVIFCLCKGFQVFWMLTWQSEAYSEVISFLLVFASSPSKLFKFFLPPCCSPVAVAPASAGTKRRTLCFGAVIHTQVTHSLLDKSASPLLLSHSIPVTSALPPPSCSPHCPEALSHSDLTQPPYSKGTDFPALRGSS